MVTVNPRDVDRYGRTVARIYVGGTDLNFELVKAGLAWFYRQYSHDSQIAAAENAARRARVGLWSDPFPVPPWSFRRSR